MSCRRRPARWRASVAVGFLFLLLDEKSKIRRSEASQCTEESRPTSIPARGQPKGLSLRSRSGFCETKCFAFDVVKRQAPLFEAQALSPPFANAARMSAVACAPDAVAVRRAWLMLFRPCHPNVGRCGSMGSMGGKMMLSVLNRLSIAGFIKKSVSLQQ